jgi:hypothetical protein
METINTLELVNPDVFPDDGVLKGILGKSFEAYESLLEIFAENGMVTEWRYYNDGKAWLCKVQCKKRTIVWMSAWKGYMQATLYFPERYLDDIFGLDISDTTKEKIRLTKNTGKSKPCIFEIRNKAALADFSRVMQFKMIAK